MPVQGGNGDGDPQLRYARMFDEFFKRPRMASTYKPVFLNALVDVGRWGGGKPLEGQQWIRDEGNRICVGLDFLAARFAKFYWEIVAGFYARHMPERMGDPDDPKKDVVNIVKIINDMIEAMERAELHSAALSANANPADMYRAVADAAGRAFVKNRPPTLKELTSDKMAEFRRRVIAESIKPEVLDHLHRSMPDLYEVRQDEDCIVLDSEAVKYMGRSESSLRAALSHIIAKHMEGDNPADRYMSTKVDLGAEYNDRLKKVRMLESKALAQREDIAVLCKISSGLTAGLERLAVLKV